MTRVVAVLWAALLLLDGVVDGASFIEPKDLVLAGKAKTKASANCQGATSMDIDAADRAAIKEDLLQASADNILLKVLEQSATPDDIGSTMTAEVLNAGFLVPKAGALVAGFVFMGLYGLFCCWTCCPFCKICRCCAKERKFGFFVKLVVMVLLGAIVLCLIIAAGLAVRGYEAAAMGFEVTNCAAARMVDSTLNGQKDPDFLGLIPTLEIFEDLKGSLDSNSVFIGEIRTIISSTDKISNAVVLASGTLKLLRDMMAASENKLPISNTGTDLLHECALCPELEKALTPAIDTLDSSTGKALDEARAEIDNQLSGDSLASLQDSMEKASAPLIQLKETMHTAFGPFVETTTMESVSDSTNSYGMTVSVFVVIFALLLTGCGGASVGAWMFCEKKKGENGEEKYRRIPHRCACVSWCGACYYLFYAFIVGGIMTMVAIPLASMCLIMEDVDGEMLNQISGSLNLDLQDASGGMMIDMVEQCFRNPDPKANPEMLQLIMVGDDPATQVTMKEKIVGETKDTINAQFDQIGSSMGGSDKAPKLNTDPKIIELKNTLRDTKMSAMMFPRDEVATGANAATYGAMATEAALKPYMASSADCNDFTIPTGMPEEGTNVPGVSSFSTELRSYGFAPVSSTCARKVTCTDSVVTSKGQACRAANNFMGLKQGLLTSNKYKCYRFVDQFGFKCDVKNMYESPVGSGNYRDDCMQNGQLKMKPFDCTLAELTKEVQEFSGRLDKVFERLDGATEKVMGAIVDDLKGAVKKNVLDPIDVVAAGMTCGFLGQAYQSVLDGMCAGGVWGFTAMASSYVFCAVVTLFLAIVMYVVWRITIDNVNSQFKTSPEES